MEEVLYRKTKHGWVCYDREGRSVEASTKNLAYNKFFLTYGMNRSGNINSINMSDADRSIDENFSVLH